jgi:MarR family transcriptional regulator, transcriptional regulator for hemolysin
MDAQRLDRSFGFLINDIARLMRRNFDRRAQTIGLSRAQWQVLARLARYEGISQVELADMLEITPITLGRLVDRLEANGWVERRNDPDDRRTRRLHLTAKSHPVLERMWELAAQTRDEALAGVPPALREVLVDSLIAIRGNLTRKETSPSEGEDAPALVAGGKVLHG